MDYNQSEDALFEALTIERSEVRALAPPYYGYDCWWSDWRNTTGGVDYVYYNKDGNKHRLYGPAYISKKYDIEEWWKDGRYHRIGGPAIQHRDNQYWFKDGKKHRLDGPAIITGGGPKEYWIDGQKLSPKEYKKEIARRKRKGLIK